MLDDFSVQKGYNCNTEFNREIKDERSNRRDKCLKGQHKQFIYRSLNTKDEKSHTRNQRSMMRDQRRWMKDKSSKQRDQGKGLKMRYQIPEIKDDEKSKAVYQR